jgi:GNAT superfamily N-acetyltransferase
VIIREISINDAPAVAELSGELGYPVSAEAMQIRIEALRRLANHAVYVACKSNAVVGWIDVGIVHHLQTEPYGEIGGLVVSDQLRSSGIGRQLVAVAEQWARDRGVSNMLVRSRTSREAAHRFYEREGYARTKTSAVFTKGLLSG